MIFQFKSLQQRLAVLLLLPVAVLLTATGAAAYLFARNSLLKEWHEATVLKLQRAAHYVDMRLAGPKEWLRLYQMHGGGPNGVYLRKAIFDQLRADEGVIEVRRLPGAVRKNPDEPDFSSRSRSHQADGKPPVAVTISFADISEDHRRTVSLISEVPGKTDASSERLEVGLDFDHLFEAVMASGWWQEHEAFLVDDAGMVLAATSPEAHPRKLGYSARSIDAAILEAMGRSTFGTVVGKGLVPETVSGFYRLHEAPWSLVIVAPGEQIFRPILCFRNIFG